MTDGRPTGARAARKRADARRSSVRDTFPHTPGNEVLGTTPDDRRYLGLTRGGGYAEHAGAADQLGVASAGFALAASAAHGVARLDGEDVPARTFAQDLLGVAPFGAGFRAGGFIENMGTSFAADALSSIGLIDTLMSTFQNMNTPQAQATPDSENQAAGPALMEGFDSAWQAPTATSERLVSAHGGS
ncbi:hypothetical protein EBN88_22100 [Streptomyces triticirhizae]|uniref:Uncharacterized protein n=1 Tax=Streptomyces triticirhizae TaxID=2483353 RepID=A0A3M2LI49_9ACTN|nr:hypothetical protein EBN88_22100 [Streptomyces triticirhizae]